MVVECFGVRAGRNALLLKGQRNDVASEASIDDCAAFWSWRRLKPTLLGEVRAARAALRGRPYGAKLAR